MNTGAPIKKSHLASLDYSVVQQCMHCGLCLPTCPTYDATKLERNSPRGRIALMRSIADGRLEATRTFADEMYFCLGCLACMTACPAGVNYAELFEHARAEAEASGVLNTPRRNAIRNFTLRWLFMDLSRLQLLGVAMRLYQQLGLQTLLRRSGILKLIPARLRELEAMTPEINLEFSADLIAPITPPLGTKRYRVALLTGCAQDLIFSGVNRDTAEVLAQNGCEVITPPEQYCCGSLHAHNGEWELAQQLARKQIDQFPPEQFDAIISNAGGCGSHLKHYQKLLADDPEYFDRAVLWDQKLKDIHEWLAEIGVRAPVGSGSINGETLIVTYHESCHLCHGQKVTTQPRELLRTIPNLRLVELPESSWCCGSAGIYNLIQPEMANDLLDRKIRHIKSTGATVVATGNPGCLLQLVNGAKEHGLNLRVVHPITLLAEAYPKELTHPAMRSKAEIVSLLENPGIIAVVRAKRADQIIPLSEALLAGGVVAIEVTMTTPNAIAAIRQACAHFGKRALIGVGTVLDDKTCRAALDAGAEFVVTPVLKTEFVPLAHAAGRPIMLGAYTPSEAQSAHEAGADFVKIFPADALGAAYVKAIRAPLPHLRLVPTGGVDIHNVAEFLKVGCAALGVGGTLVSAKILQEDNWPELENKARLFAEAARAAKT